MRAHVDSMRTTLDIDEQTLFAVRSLARQTGRSMGKVVSELLAKALRPNKPACTRNGLPVFPSRGEEGPATMELVNELRDGDV